MRLSMSYSASSAYRLGAATPPNPGDIAMTIGPIMGIAPQAVRRARAESDDKLSERISALEGKVADLTARITKLEKASEPAEPSEPEARSNPWASAIAAVANRRHGPGVRS
jgi:hypothetical protein